MPQRVAAVITSFFPYSHADVILSKFIKGFPTDDHGRVAPRTKVTGAYLEQVDRRDMGLPLLWRNGATVYQSVRGALTAGEGKELAVDGVLLIGEHGDYPHDELGRHMYPRRNLFEQICGVFAETGAVCPVFCDKHLAYNWADAKWMYDRAKQLGVPFMAGSSLPLCHRRPWLEHPKGIALDGAVSLGYAGVEAYGYHAIETLQCMVERRAGGETGVAAVTYLGGAEVWRAMDDGRIDAGLVQAALDAVEDKPAGAPADHCQEPMAYLFEYRDGLRAATVMLTGYLSDFAYAARFDGQVQGTEFYLQRDYPHAHFNYLSLNIEEMFVTGRPTYVVERTLLTTGMIDAVMVSRHQGGRLETPWLDVSYESYDTLPWRTQHPRPTGENLAMWPPR